MHVYKSGLILGALALFVAAGATLISPICAPCAVIFLGLGAGYLAGVFDNPATTNSATRAGAIGGAVGGAGAILGQILGAVLNNFIMGPQDLQTVYQNLGLPTGGPGVEQGYWIGVVGSAICSSLLDVLLMAAFGALGAYLWWQTTGKNLNRPAISQV
jgi:hypothetical protein